METKTYFHILAPCYNEEESSAVNFKKFFSSKAQFID